MELFLLSENANRLIILNRLLEELNRLIELDKQKPMFISTATVISKMNIRLKIMLLCCFIADMGDLFELS